MTKIELIENTLSHFDPEALKSWKIWERHHKKRHPWMRFKRADIELAVQKAKKNYYSLELGCNMAWHSYISQQLKLLKNASSDKAVEPICVPFGEAFLLAGLDAHSAHADEIFQPSITEMEA